MSDPLSIAIFSDVICPWCFLGKRRLERALDELGLTSTAIVRWLPFELNPDMPPEGMARALYRTRKFGADRAATLDRDMTQLGLSEGVRFAFDRMEQTPNTRKAHLLIAFASRQGRGNAAAEALFTAYFEGARDIGRDDVLAEIGVGIGLDAGAVTAALADRTLQDSIVDLEHEAARLGISGVPFFILNDEWGISGAQPADAWLDVLRRMPNFGAKASAG
jgi:predicted DsbA family dithiol-disulfide isomerase